MTEAQINPTVADQPSEAVKSKIKYHIQPTKYFNYEEKTQTWSLEIHLPGVKKGNIKFRVLPTFFDLEAKRDQALYTVSNYFPWQIDVESVEGKYEDGLLHVSGKIKNSMDEAFTLQIK